MEIDVNGEMQPYDPEEWASLEMHSVMCKLGATEAGRYRQPPGPGTDTCGKWDVGGTGVILDRREGYDFAGPNDHELARRRFTCENPYLLFGSLSAQHLIGHEREKECIAKTALCKLYEEQNDAGRWYVHEQNNPGA